MLHDIKFKKLFATRHCQRSVAIIDMRVADFSIEDCFVPRNDAGGELESSVKQKSHPKIGWLLNLIRILDPACYPKKTAPQYKCRPFDKTLNNFYE
jgi:hypothetical protein